MSIARLIAQMAYVPPPATFILSNTYSGTGASVAMSWAGAALGDLALVYTNNDVGGAITPPAGWATQTYVTPSGYTTQLFTKLLNGADIAAGSGNWTSVRSPDMGAVLAVYRGPVTATKRSTDGQSGTTALTLTGFTKGITGNGLVSVMSDRQTTDVPVIPSGFTSRASTRPGGSNFLVALADLPASSYANGTSVVWSGVGQNGPRSAWLIELL